MSRKPLPDFDMDAFLSGKRTNTERIQSEHGESTERVQEERDKEHFKKYKDTDLEVFTVRLMQGARSRLKTYFAKRGLSLSQGIRQIVQDFMERYNI